MLILRWKEIDISSDAPTYYLLMGRRVCSVYQRNKFILALLTFEWMAHIGLASFMLRRKSTLQLCVVTPQVDACCGRTYFPAVRYDENEVSATYNTISYSTNHNPSYVFDLCVSLVFFLPPVLFDSMVAGFFSVGLYKRSKPFISRMPLVNLIIRDGLLHFFAVFGSNVAWMMIGFILHYKSQVNPPDTWTITKIRLISFLGSLSLWDLRRHTCKSLQTCMHCVALISKYSM